MTTMVEKVARAMQESKVWPVVFEAGSARILARAVIEAMGEKMNLDERVGRLERLVAELADALLRKDSDQDGDWGWEKFHDRIRKVAEELKGPEAT